MRKITQKENILLKEFLDEARSGMLLEVYTPEPYANYATRLSINYQTYTPALVFDISYYQNPINTETFKRIGGDGVIVKATMGYGTDAMLDTHIANLKSAGIYNFSLYHWFDPTSPTLKQLDLFTKAINKHGPKSVWIDVEQCWKNWSKYWDYIYRRCAWADVPKYTPAELLVLTKRFMDALKARHPDLVIGIYTGKWFIDSYCPPLASLMVDYKVWLAQYVGAYKGYADEARVGEITRDAAMRSPVLPEVFRTKKKIWDLWQITSGIRIMDLTSGNIDFNISGYSQEEFTQIFFSGSPIETEPPQGWRVMTTAGIGLNIRYGPGLKYNPPVGLLPKGTVVVVDAIDNGWLHLQDGRGWISKIWTKEV